MNIQDLKIVDLKAAAYNPNEMTEEQIGTLAVSLKYFESKLGDCVNPIIVNNDMTVIGGHQRLKALEKLGKETAPCIVVDVDKLDEMRLNMALNMHGELDRERVKVVVENVDVDETPIEVIGMTEAEVEELMTATVPAKKEPKVCPNCGYEM